MNRKELLVVPKRKNGTELRGVAGVYVIPSGRKHESGWACIDFVASFQNNRPMIGFGGCCDDIAFYGEHFRMDCDYPSRIIHIWNSHGTFTVSGMDISSLNFTEE